MREKEEIMKKNVKKEKFKRKELKFSHEPCNFKHFYINFSSVKFTILMKTKETV